MLQPWVKLVTRILQLFNCICKLRRNSLSRSVCPPLCLHCSLLLRKAYLVFAILPIQGFAAMVRCVWSAYWALEFHRLQDRDRTMGRIGITSGSLLHSTLKSLSLSLWLCSSAPFLSLPIFLPFPYFPRILLPSFLLHLLPSFLYRGVIILRGLVPLRTRVNLFLFFGCSYFPSVSFVITVSPL